MPSISFGTYDSNLIKKLQYEASKKPHIKLLCDNIETLSEQDIEEANVPLKWFKSALKMFKQKKTYDNACAKLSEMVVDIPTNDPPYEIRRWTGQTVFLRTIYGNNHLSEVQIEPSDLLFMAPQIWLKSSMIHEESRANILANSIPVCFDGKINYIKLYNKELVAKAPLDAPVILTVRL